MSHAKVRPTSIVLVAIVLVVINFAVADVGGKITGAVKDQSDAAIPGVTVTAVNVATGAKQTTTTDAQGTYAFPVLSVGQYELNVNAEGFRPYRRTGLAVVVNSTLVVDVALFRSKKQIRKWARQSMRSTSLKFR
jgi:hypothetical protein